MKVTIEYNESDNVLDVYHSLRELGFNKGKPVKQKDGSWIVHISDANKPDNE